MKEIVMRLAVLPLVLAVAACGGREAGAATDAQAEEAASAAVRDDAQAASAPATDPASGSAVENPAAAAEPSVDGTPAAPANGSAAAGGASEAAAAPSSPEQDRASAILTRVERAATAIRTMEADFAQTLDVPLLNTTQRSTGKLYQKRPDRFMMRFSDPAGDIMVADGRHFWLYYPSADASQVIRTSIAGGEQVDLHQQFLSNPNQRFVATLNGEERVAGRDAYVMTLVPRQASPYKVLRIWVDKQDYMVRRFEMTEDNDTRRRVELRNVRTNHELRDDLFTFTPPAGAQVYDQ